MKEGGYYFDIDIGVVTPVRLADGVGFATVLEAKLWATQPRQGFFQAFMAAAPRHPILKEALDIMLAYYEGTHKLISANMGPSTLKEAFDAVPKAQQGEARGPPLNILLFLLLHPRTTQTMSASLR